MAYADYLHCIRCDAKVIYDANVDYDDLGSGRIIGICDTCVDAIGAAAMGAITAMLSGDFEVKVEAVTGDE